MFGTGEYVAEQTEGITRVEYLPKPKLVRCSGIYIYGRTEDDHKYVTLEQKR